MLARYNGRREALANRLADVRDRASAMQQALAAANEAASETHSFASELKSLEGTVCSTAERIGALREALSNDEAGLAARLMAQAARLKVLRADADAAAAALRTAQIEAEAAAGVAASHSATSLADAMAAAKEEQVSALRAASEEHEALLASAAAQRSARLADAAARAEAQVSALMREEASLVARVSELSAAVTNARAEADVASSRRAMLVSEVEALKAACSTAEAQDVSRLNALRAEVTSLEAQAAALRAGPSSARSSDSVLAEADVADDDKPGAVLAVEAEAREAERARWAERVAEVTASGEAALRDVRTVGAAQCAAAVSALEAQYMADFEAALAELTRQQAAAAEQCATLSAEYEQLTAAVAAAKAEHARVLAVSAAAAAEERAHETAARAQLRELSDALRTAWRERGVDAATIMRFVRQLSTALPYSDALAQLFAKKLASLQAAAPILRAITRREVLLYRLQHIPRAVHELLRATPGAAPGEQQAALAKLRAEFASASQELVSLTASLRRDAAAYEESQGAAFMYNGVPVSAMLEETDSMLTGKPAVHTASP